MFKFALQNRIKAQSILFIVLMGFVQFSVAENKPVITLEEASKQVLKTSKGKILSAKTTNSNGQKTHRIQVLTPTGRVKIFQIPATNPRYKSDYYSQDRTNRNRINRYSNRYNNQGTNNLNTMPKNLSTTTSKDSKQK